MKRRTYTHIYFYIGKEFIFSFIVAFLFFFFIFFINQLLLLAEDILSKKVPLTDVIRLIFYSLPLISSLSFPFGSLVGALMAVGRFSSDNEILAFRASGIPHRRLFIPLVFLSALFAFISFGLNDYFLPKGTINFGKLYRDLLYKNPGMELEPHSIKYYQDSIIITGDVDEQRIQDILIIDKTSEKAQRVISAKSANLRELEEQQGIISLKLDQVFSHIVDYKKHDEFEYMESEKMHYNILLKDISFSLRNPGPSEMSSVDVYSVIQEKEKDKQIREEQKYQQSQEFLYELAQDYHGVLDELSVNKTDSLKELTRLNNALDAYKKISEQEIRDRSLQLYKLEFYKKFAIPFACFIFIVFAFPVGLMTKRSGRSVGFGIGLLMSVLYWGMLFAGQTLGLRMQYPPFISMWMPNVVILLLGLLFFLIRGRR